MTKQRNLVAKHNKMVGGVHGKTKKAERKQAKEELLCEAYKEMKRTIE